MTTAIVLAVLFGGFLLWIVASSESANNAEIRRISDAMNDRNLIENRKVNEMCRRNLIRETKIPIAPKRETQKDL